jgi:hypothetical protein
MLLTITITIPKHKLDQHPSSNQSQDDHYDANRNLENGANLALGDRQLWVTERHAKVGW